MYSQNNEEEVIKKYFSNFKNGKFLDIGAFHPFVFSNTRCLYEMGWHGVLVEPSPTCSKSLMAEYGNNAQITILPLAVTCNNDYTVSFYDSNGDAISTTNKALRNKWQKSNSVVFNKISVKAINIVDLVEKHALGADFLSLDIEGENMDIFKNLPTWFLSRLNMICVEHDGFHEEIEQTLLPIGFKKCLLNAENIILCK